MPDKRFEQAHHVSTDSEKKAKPFKSHVNQRRPFLNTNGQRAVTLGLIALGVAGGVKMADITHPDNKPLPASTSALIADNGPYVPLNPLEVNLVPTSGELKGIAEIYLETYEITKGAIINDGKRFLTPEDVPNPGSGIPVDWDSLESIQNKPLNGSDKFTAKYIEIGYGDDENTNQSGTSGNGLWMKFEAKQKDGTNLNIYIPISPSNDNFIKPLNTGGKGKTIHFVGLNDDGTATDPNTSEVIKPSQFNEVYIPHTGK